MKIQLSISLLASDRADSLERCLDSLRELMIKVPSELIIVFTGKDERVLEIAGRYTDKIIPFTWCNDFSAARNVGLKEAKGEWFLYLDDDEWFEDTEAISRFFITGEYKRYSSAYYCQRNYLNWNGTKFSDFYAYRMNRIVPGIRFENPIHEEMVPSKPPFKILDAYVHHYGYVDKIKGKTGEKTSRNIPLLLKDIEKRPGYIKNYIQLTNEYYVRKEWDKAEEYCRKGRELCKDKGESPDRRWFQAYLACVLYEQSDKMRAAQEIEKVVKEEKPCELVSLILYNYLRSLYVDLRMPEQAVEYGMKFEKLLESTDANPRLWEEQRYGNITEDIIKSKDNLYPGRMNSTLAALQIKDLDCAEYFLNLLPWDEEYQIQQHYYTFDKWKKLYRADFQEVLSRLTFDSPYLLLQRILTACEQEDSQELGNLFTEGMEKIDDVYLQYQLIKAGLLHNIDLSPLAQRMDLGSWKACTEKAAGEMTLGEMEKVKGNLDAFVKKHVAEALWLRKLLLEKELFQGGFMKGEIYSGLKDYCHCVLDFYKAHYRDEIFTEDNRHLLPAECRFAFLGLEAMEEIGKGEMVNAVRIFRSALRVYPDMTSVVNEIIRYLKQEMNLPPVSAGEEFQQLAVQMKDALRGMMQAGQYQQALPIVEQLLPLLPEDLELLRMRQQILRG